MTEHYVVVNGELNADKQYYDNITLFSSYEKAETSAKRLASKHQKDFIILKAFATAKAVVPQIEVVKH